MIAALLGAIACAGSPEEAADRSVVEAVYNAFASGDIAAVTSDMDENIVWLEAEGNPYADKNPYSGPDEIVEGLFARLGSEWEAFTATPQDYIVDGERIVVLGRYGGVYTQSGKSIDAPFVHLWTVRDGKIIAFRQYTDTAAHVFAMTP